MANKKYVNEEGLQTIVTNTKKLLNDKVDKVDGKGLSTNDYTTTEKNKLASIANNANNYSLPKASASNLGGIKVGTNLSIDSNGILSAIDTTYTEMQGATSSASGQAGLVPKPEAGNQGKFLKGDGTWGTPTDTTYTVATTSKNGLMSKEDKTKLDDIETGANKTIATTITPKANGTATIGTDTGYAKGDHIHPLQTSVSGNAGSATKLQTARNINNVAFNGTANITVTANPTPNSLSTENLNDIKTPGFYSAGGNNSVISKPSNIDSFGLLVYKSAGGYVVQELTGGNQNSLKKYIRQFNSTTWSNWTEMKYTDNDTTYNVATTTSNGLMSKDMVVKLNGIEVEAQKNTVTGVKGSSESTYRTGNIDITKANIGLGSVENKSSATIRGELTSSNVTTALGFTPINPSTKGVANGVASLGADGKVPSTQLPSYVDDVLEYEKLSSFPETGEAGKIYIAKDTNKTYRWSGTAYVEISSSLALGETESTAFAGNKGKTAYDHAIAKGSAFASGLYKVTTNAEGHITAATAVQKSDITALGIPSTNTTYSVVTTSANGLMSKDDKTKLDGIANNANNYIHPTTSGNKHIPSGGSAGQILRWSADGTATWGNDNNTTYSVATTTANGLMSKDDKAKLDGLSNYDDTELQTSITNLTTTVGNKVEKVSGKGLSTNDFTASYKTKLDGITSGATKVETSTTNGNIKINGVEKTIYTQPALTKSDVTTALGYTPPTTNTTYSVMGGASASANGTSGLVPAPTKGNQTKYLRADGTWETPTNTTYAVATTSANGLMSKDMVTKLNGIATGATANSASSTIPKANGTAAVGTESAFARGDHIHPLQTTVSGNAGTATKLATARSIALTGAVTGSANFDGSANASITTTLANFDASKITSGTIDIARLPAAALERLVTVADDAARFKLTTANIQLGDTVKVTSTNKMYFVIDTSKLAEDAGYTPYVAGSAATAASCTGNSATATKATQDSSGQQINTTYIKALSVNGRTITYTKGNGTTGTITTQDTNTTYSTVSKTAAGLCPTLPNETTTTKYLRQDGTWVKPPDTNTTYSNMGAATASAAGTSGLVPAPAAGKQTSFLRGDGTWVVPTNTTYTQGTGITISGTTITNSGVRSIASGSSNGTISVNTNGTSANVSVKGLAAAAYKGVDTSMTKDSTSTNVPTTAAVAACVKAAVASAGGCTTQATSLTCTLPDNL